MNAFANKSSYEIIYPDGSKITYNTKNKIKEELNNDKDNHKHQLYLGWPMKKH